MAREEGRGRISGYDPPAGAATRGGRAPVAVRAVRQAARAHLCALLVPRPNRSRPVRLADRAHLVPARGGGARRRPSAAGGGARICLVLRHTAVAATGTRRAKAHSSGASSAGRLTSLAHVGAIRRHAAALQERSEERRVGKE